MIFPAFLFLTGGSMTFSFASRLKGGAGFGRVTLHILARSTLLVAEGLFLDGFPVFDMHNLRIPGVLQRIGLCYLRGGLFTLAA